MKSLMILTVLFMQTSFACRIDPKYPKHELTTAALNKIFKEYYFSVHELVSIKSSDFSFNYSDPNMSAVGCPDIYKISIIANYLDENQVRAEFRASVIQEKGELKIQLTRTCCKK